MQTLVFRPRFGDFLNLSWRKASSFRAFSTSSDHTNQSRGGLPRFFSDVLPPSKGSVVRVQGDEFWHMTKVLRLGVNDRVELFNGKGGLIEGCIQSIDRTGVDFVAFEDPKLVLPQSTQWHVFASFGTLKGGRADWLVEKCTELGANSVTPLLTERSPSISENRVHRLQRVILAAAKQCQRLHEMTLNPPTKIVSLLPIVAQSKLSFVALAEATPVISVLTSSRKEPSGLIIIGPEGDFTEKEVNTMIEAGATAVGLGPHRLRIWMEVLSRLAVSKSQSESHILDQLLLLTKVGELIYEGHQGQCFSSLFYHTNYWYFIKFDQYVYSPLVCVPTQNTKTEASSHAIHTNIYHCHMFFCRYLLLKE